VERLEARVEPCPDTDKKRGTTVLLLAVFLPPAAHLYYGYTALGCVQIGLYLLMLLPLALALGYQCKPVPAGARYWPWRDMVADTLREVDSKGRVLVWCVAAAVVMLVALLAWQMALVVRIVTGDFAPANGCPATPL